MSFNMRNKPVSTMQKTYDDCFLICSTAVYFEGKNNEAEALRSWRNALDQIYYHNAYRMPAGYRPRSETERALQESLRQMELQCKERVDLLDALRESRKETANGIGPEQSVESVGGSRSSMERGTAGPGYTEDNRSSEWLGGGTIPPVDYTDLSRPSLPKRPVLAQKHSSSSDKARSKSVPQGGSTESLTPLAPSLSLPQSKARTPSPEKRGGMLRTLRKDGSSRSSSSKMPSTLRSRPASAAKAATLAWGPKMPQPASELPIRSSDSAGSGATLDPGSAAGTGRESKGRASLEQPSSARKSHGGRKRLSNRRTESQPSPFYFKVSDDELSANEGRMRNDYFSSRNARGYDDKSPNATPVPEHRNSISRDDRTPAQELPSPPPPVPPHKVRSNHALAGYARPTARLPKLEPDFISYRKEYPTQQVNAKKMMSVSASRQLDPSKIHGNSPARSTRGPAPPRPSPRRKGVPPSSASKPARTKPVYVGAESSDSSGLETAPRRYQDSGKAPADSLQADLPPTPTSQASDGSDSDVPSDAKVWQDRVGHLMKNLPRGVDAEAAKQIFNEIVIQGDEVHWDDVAGLDVAKNALKEAVVYPFLRPDLFMGLREPARGMLLFGPPGTGKTMLARAVATESRSTFFAISASSLTSKFLGESEKLVRALFALAKALAPSIIFVDEIDSLLSSRSGSGEHEATRRIKTEFLIQWSDLAKAAAGREQSEKEKKEGDASRVLVLAATNLPWAIDEAARRRFVRRQYIPLPEDHVRKQQLKTLLSHQKQDLTDEDLDRLIELTDGFSGSDITALAKDAAMGPLRSLGEKLLHMTMDEIRPIQFQDFQASLINIRPSVSKQGLQEFEDWAKEFGERGG